MKSDDKAKELLTSSYILSAMRIREAMDGILEIKTAREPKEPYANTEEIVGLCGQGGRHPYFRIPVNVLESTLDRIIYSKQQLSSKTNYISRSIEEIAAACQDLRQRTYFDIGTGCVNDQLPSMVPLLPPEEIWFDGREMPMDIWRLLSFEFDIISLGASSQASVQDFSFSSFNKNGLFFRYLIEQLGRQRVSFQVQRQDIPLAWTPAFTQPLSMNVSLARIFFEAGSLLTPLADEDYIKSYAAIRYQHWIDRSNPELRVLAKFNEDTVDCRYRGLFAEETAIGLMAIVLSDIFGAKPINNTVEVVPPKLLQPGKPIADFIAQAINPKDSKSTTIIAESKGSLGRKISKARQYRAKQQVEATNISFSGSNENLLLTFASTICFANQNQNTHCLVVDPPYEFESDPIKIDPAEAWKKAYAKCFRFIGMETIARQILNGEPTESIRSFDFNIQHDNIRNERDKLRCNHSNFARERFGMDLILDAGICAVGIDKRILQVLSRGINTDSLDIISEILDSRRERRSDRFHGSSFDTSLGFGCIYYADIG